MSVRKHTFNDDDNDNNAQIPFEISAEVRQRIRKAAIRNNLSISDLLEQAFPVETDSNQQQGIINLETIGRLRRLREQILQDHQGKPFEDSTEMIRQMREERTQHLESLLEE
jgi:hypothetical protein